MELCTKGLGGSVAALKARGITLSCVRTCVVVAEERPRIALTQSFTKLFSGLNLRFVADQLFPPHIRLELISFACLGYTITKHTAIDFH